MSMQINSKQISFGTYFSPEFKKMLADKLKNNYEPDISNTTLDNLEAIKNDGKNGFLDFKTSKYSLETANYGSGEIDEYITHFRGDISLKQEGKHRLKVSSAKYTDDGMIKYTPARTKRRLFDECLEKLSLAAVKNTYHETTADKEQRIKDLLA